MGSVVASLVAVIRHHTVQTIELETVLADRLESHPDAKIIRSLPGLGMIVGARVLAEFGDDPNRYANAKCRKNYAARHPSPAHPADIGSCSPDTPATDGSRTPATSGPSPREAPVPGARAFYDQRRAAGDTHHRALRALPNRLIGILHGCLRHATPYNEHLAWVGPPNPQRAPWQLFNDGPAAVT
jgi:hypothetical protein